MSAALEHVHELMTQSLLAWGLVGTVHRTSDGAILISCRQRDIRIEPASPDLPFRWIVAVDNRSRAATSLVGVLRQVRAALDPGYAIMRARIAPSALVPM
jgi:hypothetical protein